jgi:uncharacterized protein YegP (UPF0339 family)
MNRRPRWELCGKRGGYWVRFRSSNGNIIMSSETYVERRDAIRAIELVSDTTSDRAAAEPTFYRNEPPTRAKFRDCTEKAKP